MKSLTVLPAQRKGLASPDPQNLIAKTKLEAERSLQSLCELGLGGKRRPLALTKEG